MLSTADKGQDSSVDKGTTSVIWLADCCVPDNLQKCFPIWSSLPFFWLYPLIKEPFRHSSSTSSQSLYVGNSADKCIDGITNGLKGKTDDLCQTNCNMTPWLALVFGSEFRVSVQKVVLANSDNSSLAARTRNVNVWLANVLPTLAAILFESGSLLWKWQLTWDIFGTRRCWSWSWSVEILSAADWQSGSGRYVVVQMENDHWPSKKSLLLACITLWGHVSFRLLSPSGDVGIGMIWDISELPKTLVGMVAWLVWGGSWANSVYFLAKWSDPKVFANVFFVSNDPKEFDDPKEFHDPQIQGNFNSMVWTVIHSSLMVLCIKTMSVCCFHINP